MKRLNEILTEKVWNKAEFHNEGELRALHKSLYAHYNNNETNNLREHEHWDSVSNYQNGSSAINRALWNKHNPPNKHAKEDYNTYYKGHVDKINNVLHSFKTPHNLHVWSGTYQDPTKYMNKEGVVHHPAFMSTTIDPDISRGFAKFTYHEPKNHPQGRYEGQRQVAHILHIHVPKGSPGAFIAPNNPEKGYFGEREFTLPSGMNLKHLASETVKAGQYSKKAFYRVHHMQLMPYKPYKSNETNEKYRIQDKPKSASDHQTNKSYSDLSEKPKKDTGVVGYDAAKKMDNPFNGVPLANNPPKSRTLADILKKSVKAHKWSAEEDEIAKKLKDMKW